jgi:hypothetical protein
MEINSGAFSLQGWIVERRRSRGLDDLDPYADNLDYPPYIVGERIAGQLGLTADKDAKCWHETNSEKDVLICETWSSVRERMEEKPNQTGMRLRASLSFLKRLCNVLNCHLILDIGIQRNTNDRYRTEPRGHIPPTHKIYILSEDGRLRTTDQSYELG